MKDEIKEVLDFIKEQIEKETLSYEPDVELSKEEAKLLLDCITNLQEENERYKKIFEGKERFYKNMPDDVDFIIISKADYDRQQEDKKLKEGK